MLDVRPLASDVPPHPRHQIRSSQDLLHHARALPSKINGVVMLPHAAVPLPPPGLVIAEPTTHFPNVTFQRAFDLRMKVSLLLKKRHQQRHRAETVDGAARERDALSPVDSQHDAVRNLAARQLRGEMDVHRSDFVEDVPIWIAALAAAGPADPGADVELHCSGAVQAAWAGAGEPGLRALAPGIGVVVGMEEAPGGVDGEDDAGRFGVDYSTSEAECERVAFGDFLSLLTRWVKGDFHAFGEVEHSLVDVESKLDGKPSELRVVKTESSIGTSSSHA